MSKTSTYDRAIEAAMTAAAKAKDISALPVELRTIALVHAAQGTIDNGGLQYFFEADFPGNPPYGLFVDAYRSAGADDAAAALSQAAALFPFADPHKHATKRNKFMDSFKDEDGDPIDSPFEPLTKKLCGNKAVWTRLRRYIERNAKALGI